MHPRTLALTVTIAAVAASCGSTARQADPPPADPDVTITGLDIKFDKTEYTAKAGPVKFAYIDKGKQSHSLVMEDVTNKRVGKRLAVDPGETAGITLTLAAGTYLLYCDVPGHRQSMNAKLVVG